LKDLLDTGDHSAEEVARRIRVLSMGARDIEPAHFGTLATALLSRRRPKIRHNRQALRTFAVDAIEAAAVLDKPPKEVGDDSLDRHFATGYGIFAGADTQEAVLLFNPTRARWVSRETWHPSQDGKMQLDGAYLFKVPYSREPELVMDILKYGADVEVVAPESLRKAVAEHHAEAAQVYSK